MKMLTLLMALTSLTACDYFESKEFQKERNDRQYRSAMEDYRSGRLDSALSALKKVCSANPANASARFQLACLLQDHAKDYLGAVCAFREYLLQQPESDRSQLAETRLSLCEKALAKELATRYSLNAVAVGSEARLSELQENLARAELSRAKLQKDLEQAMRRIASLNQTLEQYKTLALAAGSENAAIDEGKAELSEAKALASEEEEPADAPAKDVAEAQSLAKADDAESSSQLLHQSPDAKAKRDAARSAEKKAASGKKEPFHEERPAVYVVQEGDTLYKLALRFYGRTSAWKAIREANKAQISTDGRLRAHQKLVLPNE